MTSALLALALAIPVGWLKAPNPVKLRVSFSQTGCVTAPTGTTFARNSTATVLVSGVEQTCTANQIRVNEYGALIEQARTNRYLNSDSPAAQTVTLNSTGTWKIWITGSGSVDVAAGTVTATGLPCTVTASATCTVSVTVAGTVTISDPTGSVTFVQVEKGTFPSSAIHTTGSVGSRAADVLSITNPLKDMANGWCIRIKGRPVSTRSWFNGAADTNGMATLGALNAANSAYLFNGNAAIGLYVRDSGNNAATDIRYLVRNSGGLRWNVLTVGEYSWIGCSSSDGGTHLFVDGFPIDGTVTGSRVVQAAPAAGAIGQLGTGNEFGGYVKEATFCKGYNPDKCGRLSGTAARWANSVSGLGDSITWGYSTPGVTTPYPVALVSLLPSGWTTGNDGYPGYRTDQILGVWNANLASRWAYAWEYVIVLAGTNDVLQAKSAAYIKSYLTQIYDGVQAIGAHLVVATITPFKDNTAGWPWSVEKQAVQDEVNAWIAAQAVTRGVPIVDLYALLGGEGGDPTKLLAAYNSGDWLHPNDAGHAVIATAAEAAVHP